MRRTLFVISNLLLSPVWAVHSQQSGEVEISAQRGEAGQAPQKGEQAGQPLTNDSIVKLVKAGLGEDEIISIINTQPGGYLAGADDIMALKTAGVSGKIIAAMVNKMASGPSAAPVAAPGVSEKQDQTGPPVHRPERMPPKVQDTPSIQLPETP
jgi:hypothetical protein